MKRRHAKWPHEGGGLPSASARKNGYEMTKPERKKNSVTPAKPVAGRKASQEGGESHEISQSVVPKDEQDRQPSQAVQNA